MYVVEIDGFEYLVMVIFKFGSCIVYWQFGNDLYIFRCKIRYQYMFYWLIYYIYFVYVLRVDSYIVFLNGISFIELWQIVGIMIEIGIYFKDVFV